VTGGLVMLSAQCIIKGVSSNHAISIPINPRVDVVGTCGHYVHMMQSGTPGDTSGNQPIAKGAFALFAIFYGLLVFPIAAWLLWDDHRGLAWLAIAGVLTGAVGQLAVPLGSALVVYALTDSVLWAVVGAAVGIAAYIVVALLSGED